MDFDEYRKRGKEMVDYIADYLQNIRERRVLPDVKPGYMRDLLPDSAPLDGEPWQTIIDDVERVIMPGVTHWQSPHMHAYFPALNSFPSLLGDMLADAINCLGFTWASSPACTELESIVMNWLGKMIGLPDAFLHIPSISRGGGVIQTTASEATLVCLLAGRTVAIKRFHEHTPGQQDAEINARLVAYCSDQAHSSVEKAAIIGLVRMRYIEADENLSLGGRALEEAIKEDIKQGLIPFWVCATLGTTGACAFDNLQEVGEVCARYNMWVHVDAAYAGSAFICPEFRVWLKGIDKADSIAFNPSKWLMVHFDCTAMWIKNSGALHRTFNVEPLYLQHENSGLAIDYMHWQIPLSKRFRALKLWFVLRSYGIKGLQKHIREGVRLAQKFEALVLADHRFEIPAARYLGMVVFRIRGENNLTEKLLKKLNHRGNMHAVPASLKGRYVIRFTVTSTRTTSEDILKDWNEIRTVTSQLLEEMNVKIADRSRVPLKDTREKNEAFGSSLLLANSPMSPKIVNGSFAAIYDADEFLAKVYAGIRISNQDSPAMKRRVRGILMSGKQFSLDSHMDLVVHGISPNEVKNGIESKAITEDCEEVWEACEQMEIVEQDSVESLDSRFLLPIPIPCASPPPSPRRRFRSQSIDVGMLHAPTEIQNMQRLLNVSIGHKSEPYYSDYSLNQIFLSPSAYASNASSAKVSFESNLDSIDENSSVKIPASKRRCSDSRQLLSLAGPNLFPEKRLSEPSIRCAFYNKSFDVMSPKVGESSKRVLSQNDLTRRPFRRQISTIDERIVDEVGADGGTQDRNKMNLIAPKFQCCISDEDGRCINFDPIYHNHDPELNAKDLLRERLKFEEDFVEKFEQVCPQITDEDRVRDEFTSCGSDETVGIRSRHCDDEVIYENVKICRKCGHCTVRL
ncbi:histidine decarboxylase isoform X1 [Topomyia yanbarensis]|uniref:histidine decarboxylase isoform X1 n=1 Tax=Topomyia yanbarensis TaxID=2498891 RepID=UPI00273C21E1|nr:histidine decarboxylase isoform X1 [Topomyia yanbarensis]XP_058818539.1 histidine decarboxylase isoform X1 [Topomyia yanbarensis]XP_058818540.1 histidine decarboxylase isoform X1 [Topomyia yanbarensis]XP_058818541.1 histidine decarboxylase isoform X1 [Topomyia yanbarensis]